MFRILLLSIFLLCVSCASSGMKGMYCEYAEEIINEEGESGPKEMDKTVPNGY